MKRLEASIFYVLRPITICGECRFGRHVAANYYICKKGKRPENNKCKSFKYNNMEDLALLIYVTILAILYVMLTEGVI